MERIKKFYMMAALMVSLAVLFFFRENANAVYAASGLLWGAIILEIATTRKLPKAVKHIKRPWAMKAVFGLTGLIYLTVMIEGIKQMVQKGSPEEFNLMAFLLAPIMLLNFFKRSDMQYVYDGGLVCGEDVIEFSKMESVKWKEEYDSYKLIIAHDGEEFDMFVKSDKIHDVNEILEGQGIIALEDLSDEDDDDELDGDED